MKYFVYKKNEKLAQNLIVSCGHGGLRSRMNGSSCLQICLKYVEL